MTNIEMLAAKRIERAEAQAAWAQARADMNVDQIVLQQQRIAVLDDLIAILEVEAQKERETDARVQAERRVIGIRRALGSNRSAMDDDAERVRETAKQQSEAIERMNARAWECERLRREFEALVDRFGLEGGPLMMPISPTERDLPVVMPKLVDLTQVLITATRAPVTEEHEHTAWRRRTYSETSDTEAGRIIALVGPKPWPALSEEQRQQIRERQKRIEEQRRRNAEEWAAEAAAIPSQSHSIHGRF